jgi:hypothetical protein
LSAASVAAAAGRRATSVATSSPSKVTAVADDGPKTEINCVEGYDKNIYIGRSDGIVEWWVIDGSAEDMKVRLWRMYQRLIISTMAGRYAINIPCFLAEQFPKSSYCQKSRNASFSLVSIDPLGDIR